jgi:hypothetical protein
MSVNDSLHVGQNGRNRFTFGIAITFVMIANHPLKASTHIRSFLANAAHSQAGFLFAERQRDAQRRQTQDSDDLDHGNQWGPIIVIEQRH